MSTFQKLSFLTLLTAFTAGMTAPSVSFADHHNKSCSAGCKECGCKEGCKGCKEGKPCDCKECQDCPCQKEKSDKK